MIISVEEVKKYIETDLETPVLEAKLQALELLIRNYTNNNFQKRSIRFICPIMAQKLYLSTALLKVGDTVQISDTFYSNGIYTITEMDDDFVTLNELLMDEATAMVTKVEYPIDVVMGVVNMLKWDLENRDKIGVVQSETISRHSVTYVQYTEDNMQLGYPKTLLNFLKPYRKARF